MHAMSSVIVTLIHLLFFGYVSFEQLGPADLALWFWAFL